MYEVHVQVCDAVARRAIAAFDARDHDALHDCFSRQVTFDRSDTRGSDD